MEQAESRRAKPAAPLLNRSTCRPAHGQSDGKANAGRHRIDENDRVRPGACRAIGVNRRNERLGRLRRGVEQIVSPRARGRDGNWSSDKAALAKISRLDRTKSVADWAIVVGAAGEWTGGSDLDAAQRIRHPL
jgi:hypothetical protein